jgi:antibiotic biosynthesis monooxygenase (ABM) superfamily enzyme
MRPLGSGAGRGARSGPRPWVVRTATTLAAWVVAWVVVVALLSLMGDELGSLPLALRALVISGVLVTLMANLVMPVLGRIVARWTAGDARLNRR